MKASETLQLFVKTFKNWQEDNCLRLSAALSYYSIFSIAPLIVISISMAGLFLGEKAAEDQIHEQMQTYIGSQAAASVQTMVQSASQPQKSVVGAAIGVITLLAGAAGVFGQLKESLNTIWNVRQKPGGGVKLFLREYLLSFGMVLVIGFLLLVSLVLTAVLSGASAWFGNILNLPGAFWGAATFFISFLVVTILFATIFKILPDARIKWRNVWVGAAFTASLFEIGKFALGWYLGRPSTASTYGAAGSVVLLLLWVYYASLILFFGAEFTRVYSEAAGEEIVPSKNAEKVQTISIPGEPPLANPAPQKEHPALILSSSSAAFSAPASAPFPEPEIKTIFQEFGAALSIGAGVGILLRLLERSKQPSHKNPRNALPHDFGRLVKEGRDTLHDLLHRE